MKQLSKEEIEKENERLRKENERFVISKSKHTSFS